MTEVATHTSRGSLDAAQMAERCGLEFLAVARRDILMHGALEVPVQVLVGIEFRGVRRQEEDFDLVAMRGQPVTHRRVRSPGQCDR